MMAEVKNWCVNFDNDETILSHGLTHNLWMMQYQYSHGGSVYQGNSNQLGATTKNWRKAASIAVGDWLVAYIPSNRYFAVGRVRSPRKPATLRDSIERVINEREHNHEGIVWYNSAFYEDFTDPFRFHITNSYSKRPEEWQYNQRIDVEEWLHVKPDGITRKGLGSLKPRPHYRAAAFEIPRSFFQELKDDLSTFAPPT
ncbi:hypothetical protein N9B17_01435 [Rhodopirellula sp.]|nr:hypothetical protein [Rhodopirellula sp.]